MFLQNNKLELDKRKLRNVYNLADGNDYLFLSLHPDLRTPRGGNSYLFTLRNPSQEDEEDKVIKICKSWSNSTNEFHQKRISRFSREILALKTINNQKNIITFYFNGNIQLDGKVFDYFVMEKASYDLKDLILETNPDFQNKVLICHQILTAFKELFEQGIYHRDIKPDNFLYVNNELKVGDLGLIQFRDQDENLDEINELIGPRGWLSPEAMNKFLTYRRELKYTYDCTLDFKSDIFQLGKLFWFIFQYNVPIGRICRQDCKVKDDSIYNILAWMLNHNKQKRPSLTQLEEIFYPIFQKYAA